MSTWYEEDRFWETVPLFNEEHWEAAPVQVDAVLSLLDIEPGAAILDLPCGVGRHSLELAIGHRLYDGAGLRALLLDVGFESVLLYESLDGEPHDTSARRMVAVARKGD